MMKKAYFAVRVDLLPDYLLHYELGDIRLEALHWEGKDISNLLHVDHLVGPHVLNKCFLADTALHEA